MSQNPVVVLYAPTWDSAAQMSKHHLARYWSRSRTVLYVEAPAHPVSLLTRRGETARIAARCLTGPVRVGERLWVQSCFSALPYRARPRPLAGAWVNEMNQRILGPQVRRALRRLAIRNPVVLAGGAHALPMLDSLAPRLLAYHCSDDYTRQDNFPASFATLERDFAERCDLVITTSEELRRAKAHLHRNVHAVPNGADVEHFARTQDAGTQIAPELGGLPRPVIGYVGSVFEWIDQDMIAHAAATRPSWTFAFVGPIGTDVQRLRALPNIRFLGPRPYASLPRYLKGFDVATVPFVFHDVTLRASPVKFYEYLASGVPVVATRLPDFEPLGHLVQLVSTPEEFVAGVERALVTETPAARAARMKEATRHSWTVRFNEIDRLIEEALAATASRAEEARP